MQNKKQTAVKWLISELRKSKDFHRVINELNQRGSAVTHILNEALQMEKQQIELAYDEGDIQLVNSKQYYEQTYGEI